MTHSSALSAGAGEVGPLQSGGPRRVTRAAARPSERPGREPISSGAGEGSEAAFVIKLRRPARGPVVIILRRKTRSSGLLSRNPEIRVMNRKRRLLASEAFGVKRRRAPGPVRADPLRTRAGNHGNQGAESPRVSTGGRKRRRRRRA